MLSKFAWMLVLPYVVTASKNISQCWEVHGKESAIEICDKEYAEDLAAALNEAHRKNHPTKIAPVFKPSNFDYPSACGQEDCGKDPK